MMKQKLERMKELSAILSEAAKAYYQESREIMSNFEYDRLYDELTALEEETGTIFAGSPTQKVGYEVLSELLTEKDIKENELLEKYELLEELEAELATQNG